MIYVIRHGQTDLNKEGRLQGRSGEPLNKEGVRQAENLRSQFESISFDYVISSPQERAVQTAELASGIAPIIDPRLDVFDLGEADRLKKDEMKMSGGAPDPSVYNRVEEVDHYIKRIFEFMNELKGRYARSELTILLSGHKCTTGCIGAYFEGMPEDGNFLKRSSKTGEYKLYELSALNG